MAQRNRRKPDPHGHRADSPWAIPLAGWKQVISRTWRQTWIDNVGLVAAGVAFYGFLAVIPLLGTLVLTSEDGILAGLALSELARLSELPVRALAGGNSAWSAAGFPLVSGDERMADDPIDVWLRPYEQRRAAYIRAGKGTPPPGATPLPPQETA